MVLFDDVCHREGSVLNWDVCLTDNKQIFVEVRLKVDHIIILFLMCCFLNIVCN